MADRFPIFPWLVCLLEGNTMVRYKATANIQWVFEVASGEDPKTAAFGNIESILGEKLGDFTFIHIGKIDQLKNRQTRIVLGEFSPDEVLPYVGTEEDRRKYIVGDKEYLVKMTSQRYFVFRASRKCVSCGILGTKMLLEQHPNDTTPHFNMYAEEDGTLILMTKDHIQAKSTGGADRHSNYQTMCSVCNQLKGSDPLTIDQTRELRAIYNDNHKSLTKKAMHQLVVDLKAEMIGDRSAAERYSAEKVDSSVFMKCDVHIYRNESGYFGAAVHDKVPEANHIASVKKGSVIYPIENDDKQFRVPFRESYFSIYHGLVECMPSKATESCGTAQSC